MLALAPRAGQSGRVSDSSKNGGLQRDLQRYVRERPREAAWFGAVAAVLVTIEVVLIVVGNDKLGFVVFGFILWQAALFLFARRHGRGRPVHHDSQVS